jgi:hypothetical protein
MPQHHTPSPDNLQKKNAGNQHRGFIKTEKMYSQRDNQSNISNETKYVFHKIWITRHSIRSEQRKRRAWAKFILANVQRYRQKLSSLTAIFTIKWFVKFEVKQSTIHVASKHPNAALGRYTCWNRYKIFMANPSDLHYLVFCWLNRDEDRFAKE